MAVPGHRDRPLPPAVVGWSMADHIRAELACEALQMALDARSPGPALVFHSDRGSQYTSAEFRRLLNRHCITQSFSRPGSAGTTRSRRAGFPN
jgi:transposase InsO family protein